MTLLEVTNDVLKRLREDPATSVTLSDNTSYENLVGSFVSDIVEEVNENWDWSFLDHYVDVDLVADQRVYDLSADTSNGGDVHTSSSRTTNTKSMVVFDPTSNPVAFIFDDSSDNVGERMYLLDPYDLERRYQQDRNLKNDKPNYFTLEIDSDADGLQMVVWPIPTTSRRVRIRFNTPEDRLDPDTDGSTEILVNNRLVFLGALYMALNERGEEMGEPGNIAERRYFNALAAAKEQDIRNRERQQHYTWHRG